MLARRSAAPGRGQRRAVARDARASAPRPGRVRARARRRRRRRRGRAPAGGGRRRPSPPRRRRARPRSSAGRRAALDLALERVAGDRRRHERERDDRGPPRVEGGQLGGDHAALADQQRRRGAGVQRDLEALAHLGVDRRPSPSRRATGPATRWAELETGSSSVGPWTAPSSAARRGRQRRRASCGAPTAQDSASAGGARSAPAHDQQ